MELVLKSDWLYVLDNVLTPEECKEIIDYSNPYMQESETVGKDIENYRTSTNHFINRWVDKEFVKKINLVTEILTELPSENQEDICVVKYNKGQEYKVHHDFLDHGLSEDHQDQETKNELKRGGDRVYTVMFYLNDDILEGGTLFTDPNIEIRPKTGRCVVWKNYLDGKPNYKSQHAGLPVKEGIKYIAVKWVRRNEFK